MTASPFLPEASPLRPTLLTSAWRKKNQCHLMDDTPFSFRLWDSRKCHLIDDKLVSGGGGELP